MGKGSRTKRRSKHTVVRVQGQSRIVSTSPLAVAVYRLSLYTKTVGRGHVVVKASSTTLTDTSDQEEDDE